MTYKGQTGIGACQELNISGTTYVLTVDIDNAAATCMIIDNDSITLDCDGKYIDGQNAGNGIEIDGAFENVTIENCQIQQFNYNLYSNNNINLSIENLSALSSANRNLYFDNLDGGFFTNVYVFDSDDDGHSDGFEFFLKSDPNDPASKNELIWQIPVWLSSVFIFIFLIYYIRKHSVKKL